MIVCRVENDGEIKENKPIYVPGLDYQRDLQLSVVGPKDLKILQDSIQLDVHLIAVSYVESKEDILYVRKVLGSKGQHIKVLAKLMSSKALENFDEILEASDGIIIARGCLALSLNLEDLVYVQKYIIKKCNLVGKSVMLLTQIMESMVSHLTPSRAEVADITNAVYDGIDALILSPETAIGPHYEQAIDTMAHICFETEKNIDSVRRYNDSE